MTAVNLNRVVRGPVTAVPVVAGKGVRLVADTVNNRFVVEADETVLYEGVDGSYTTGFTLSEPLSNFERVLFYLYCRDSTSIQSSTVKIVEISTLGTTGNGLNFGLVDQFADSSWCISWCFSWSTTDNLTYTLASSRYIGAKDNSYVNPGTNMSAPHVCKVVGVNRIASN